MKSFIYQSVKSNQTDFLQIILLKLGRFSQIRAGLVRGRDDISNLNT